MDSQIAALVVKVCDARYAIAVADVVEVAAMVEAAPLQDAANPALYGVVIRRGEPMMLIDLRIVMGCTTSGIDLTTLFVVVRGENEWVGFIVDHVEGVVYFTGERVRPLNTGYVYGIVAEQDTLLKWLNVDAILSDILTEIE